MDRLLQILLYGYIISVIVIASIPGGNIASKWVGYLLLFAWFVGVLIESKKIVFPKEFWCLLLFITLSLVGLFYAKNHLVVLTRSVTLIQLAGLFLIIYNITITSKNSLIVWKRAIIAFLIGNIISVIYAMALIDYVNLSNIYNIRLGGTLFQANQYAASLVFLCMLVLVFYAFHQSYSSKTIIAIIIGLAFLNIIFTGSRQGFLGLIVGIFTLAFIYLFKTKKIKPLIYTTTSVFVIFVVASVFSIQFESFYIYERLNNLYLFMIDGLRAEIGEFSIINRLSYYNSSFMIWIDYPLTGIGLNHFEYYALDYGATFASTYAHSNYAELLATTGFLGFTTYFYIYFLIIKRFFKLFINPNLNVNNYYILSVLFSLMMSFVFMGFMRVSYYNKLDWLVLSLIITGLEVFRREYVENSSTVFNCN